MSYTPPNNQSYMNIGTPPSGNSDYSDEYNDYWDRHINNAAENHQVGEVRDVDSDDFIRGRPLTMDDLEGEEMTPEANTPPDIPPPEINAKWAKRNMPPLPNYDTPIIDINGEGNDPMMMETRSIKEYLEEDKKDNIAVLYNDKVYLTSRSIIEQQENDALVYECLEADKKDFKYIVGNLPLYNIKKIGIDISSDNAVGVEAEYIYIGGIDSLLEDEDYQLYAIIPLVDKQLISVISYNEAQKVGTGQGSGVSALHCQAGQGGLAGIIVKANPVSSGGKRKTRKTMKTRKGKGITKLKRVVKRKTMKRKRTMKRIRKANHKTRK
jgi:hypothetical protein